MRTTTTATQTATSQGPRGGGCNCGTTSLLLVGAVVSLRLASWSWPEVVAAFAVGLVADLLGTLVLRGDS